MQLHPNVRNISLDIENKQIWWKEYIEILFTEERLKTDIVEADKTDSDSPQSEVEQAIKIRKPEFGGPWHGL